MAKVYLLLRSNKQTGPHTVDELIQMGLKANDLIWIEGKSFGWSHPTEIDSLKAYVSDAKKELEKKSAGLNEAQKRNSAVEGTSGLNTSSKLVSDSSGKKIHVSLPGNTTRLQSKELSPNDLLEKKADELRKRAQAFTSGQALSSDSFIETKFNRSINEVEQDYTDWVVKQKVSKSRSFPKQKLALILIGFVLVALIYFTVNLFGKTSVEKSATVTTTEPAPPKVEPINTDTSVSEPLLQTQDNNNNNIEDLPINTSTAPKPNKFIPITTSKQKQSTTPVASTPIEQKKVENVASAPILEDRTTVSEDVTVSTTKEKKSLRQKVSGFFDKLKSKKTNEEISEEQATLPKQEETRDAERREDNINEKSTVDLTEYAELSSNVKSSSWMMGIKGLKITLRNRGNQIIQSASAEVKYYNEQNELLEKKVVQFTNVPAKKSLAVAAPDHRLADHVEFELLSATGQ